MLALDPHRESSSPETKEGARAGIEWTIYTKYYGADVALHTVQPRLDAAGAAVSSSGSQPALARAEAVVHVMNAAKLLVDGVDHAVTELGVATDALDSAGCGAEMRLLVLSHADVAADGKKGDSGAAASASSASSSSGVTGSSDGLDALEQAIQPAALEHGFEVVVADLTNPHISYTERDKRGVARVLEALQTVMWSSLDMGRARKAAPAPAAPDAEASSSEPSATNGGGGGGGGGEASSAPAGTYEAPLFGGLGAGSSGPDERAEAVLDSLLTQPGAEDARAASGDGAAAVAGPGPAEPATAAPGASGGGADGSGDNSGFRPFEEGSAEPDMEGLEALMQEALKLKMEGGSLTREQRHEQAAAVALRMAIAMGLDKDEDIAAMLGSGK